MKTAAIFKFCLLYGYCRSSSVKLHSNGQRGRMHTNLIPLLVATSWAHYSKDLMWHFAFTCTSKLHSCPGLPPCRISIFIILFSLFLFSFWHCVSCFPYGTLCEMHFKLTLGIRWMCSVVEYCDEVRRDSNPLNMGTERDILLMETTRTTWYKKDKSGLT